MLLTEFTKNPLALYKKSNTLLESTYGINVAFSKDLALLRECESQAKSELVRLMENGGSSNDRLYSKQQLIAETVAYLIESENKTRIDELKLGYANSYKYQRIVDGLAEFVTKSMNIGDSFDEAIADAMKQYRSSKYRFPDFEIQFDVTTAVKDQYEPQPEEQSALPLEAGVTYEQVCEMVEAMEFALNGGLTESDQHGLLALVAEAILTDGDFYTPDDDHSSISRQQKSSASKYLSKFGGTKLSLADREEDASKTSFKNPEKRTKLSPEQLAKIKAGVAKQKLGDLTH